jgi:hypothetical protein
MRKPRKDLTHDIIAAPKMRERNPINFTLLIYGF